MDGFGSRLVFSPDDEQLTDSYLQSYLVRSSLSDLPPVVSSFFHVADVYSAPPDELLAGLDPAPGTGDGDGRVWYLFSPVRVLGSRGARKARTVVGAGGGNECWHAEGGPRDIEKSGAGGKLQKFSYKIKTASGVVKPGWLMVLALGDQEHEGDGEFDERADPESWEWENYLSAVLNETCKQETLATAAAGQPPEETAVL
uniref:NAC domain-containing protein n=1 Tax=Oryza brachyantha TaxID=4533 RepID=J3LUG7_ORYBR